ncbi:methyl-accepting chemotaxis protein I [Enterobacter cancerogenus]|uniref:Methyl-accepting chemotaxis protein I n=1 Tax=Enterobacter cancerogenus TaxID=69218 RepID=A0A484XV33_9ENTR|nr:methyl-accepting chemotaxis protein I [Enterobacter cancerogenus]
MFKRIKVITLLISVLLVLGIMQLISAGIFINALNNDKENFNRFSAFQPERGGVYRRVDQPEPGHA